MASHSGGVCSKSERWLYDFITRSLQSHASASLPDLSEELEQNLLIALSSVSQKIERCADVVGRFSEQGGEVSRLLHNNRTCSINYPVEDGSVCITSAVSLLMSFLSLESIYVRHLVADTLVAIFKFLIETDSNWNFFALLMWTSLTESISSLVLQLQTPSPAVTDKGFKPYCLPTRNGKSETMQGNGHANANPVVSLKSNSQSLSFHTAFSVTNVLRVISKHVMTYHSHIMEIYIRLSVDSLSRIPWDSLSNILNAGSSINSSVEDWPRLRYIFLGAFLQLFCSLVDQEHMRGACCFDDSILYSKFTFLVRKLVTCCFSNNMEHKSSAILRYLRHKTLNLIIRLSSWSRWDCSSSLLWLKILKEYFEDLLYQHISICQDKHTSSIEESPFHNIDIGGEHAVFLCSCHIQRQTYLLFLTCCIKLVHLSNESFEGCIVATRTSSMPQTPLICTQFHTNGLSELLEWLDKHASLGDGYNNVEHHSYSVSCSRVASDLLQLFLDEDDMLFQILLQLLDVPFSAMHQQNSGNNISAKLDRVKVIDISNTFGPIPIFHLFLSLLSYDHSVLLDFLISVESGVPCLKYLLRCLHMFCQSWHYIEECLSPDYENAQPSSKKFKISAVSDGSTRENGQMQAGRGCACEDRWKLKDAKDCLFSLKTSIEDLQKKNLCPYNPSALLRSLTQFQQLDHLQKNVTGDGT